MKKVISFILSAAMTLSCFAAMASAKNESPTIENLNSTLRLEAEDYTSWSVAFNNDATKKFSWTPQDGAAATVAVNEAGFYNLTIRAAKGIANENTAQGSYNVVINGESPIVYNIEANAGTAPAGIQESWLGSYTKPVYFNKGANTVQITPNQRMNMAWDYFEFSPYTGYQVGDLGSTLRIEAETHAKASNTWEKQTLSAASGGYYAWCIKEFKDTVAIGESGFYNVTIKAVVGSWDTANYDLSVDDKTEANGIINNQTGGAPTSINSFGTYTQPVYLEKGIRTIKHTINTTKNMAVDYIEISPVDAVSPTKSLTFLAADYNGTGWEETTKDGIKVPWSTPNTVSIDCLAAEAGDYLVTIKYWSRFGNESTAVLNGENKKTFSSWGGGDDFLPSAISTADFAETSFVGAFNSGTNNITINVGSNVAIHTVTVGAVPQIAESYTPANPELLAVGGKTEFTLTNGSEEGYALKVTYAATKESQAALVLDGETAKRTQGTWHAAKSSTADVYTAPYTLEKYFDLSGLIIKPHTIKFEASNGVNDGVVIYKAELVKKSALENKLYIDNSVMTVEKNGLETAVEGGSAIADAQGASSVKTVRNIYNYSDGNPMEVMVVTAAYNKDELVDVNIQKVSVAFRENVVVDSEIDITGATRVKSFVWNAANGNYIPLEDADGQSDLFGQ